MHFYRYANDRDSTFTQYRLNGRKRCFSFSLGQMFENLKAKKQVNRPFANCPDVGDKLDLLESFRILFGFRHQVREGFIADDLCLREKHN